MKNICVVKFSRLKGKSVKTAKLFYLKKFPIYGNLMHCHRYNNKIGFQT